MESDGGGDSRVLQSGDQDANMVDVGEKGRPPDISGSWVAKVTGMNGGGMLVPEKFVDESFVEARVRLEFPNGEDGEPEITIEREVLEAMNGLWKQCLIVKVLGRNVTLAGLSRKLKEMWKPLGSMFVMDLPRQFFMVRFEKEEEYLAAVTGGPWKAFGSQLLVKAWSPEFDPLRDEITTTPVWVRLSNLPVNFYHKSILMAIARGLGTPIRVDLTTLNFERARFARVCVEVNLAKPLKGTVLVNGERYFVSYEGLTTIFSKCGLYGHLVHSCPRGVQEKAVALGASNVREKAVVLGSSNMRERDNGVESGKDGFTMVRRPRRSGPVVNSANSVEVTPRVEAERNLREIPEVQETGGIVTSNRFGNLGEDMIVLESREAPDLGEENKENEKISNKQRSSPNVMKGRDGVVFTSLNNQNKGVKTGPRTSKPTEINRPKTRQNRNRPGRGLVFGPARGEEERSLSGKRLRVEKENVGRRGGVFGNETDTRVEEQEGENPSGREMVSVLMDHSRVDTEMSSDPSKSLAEVALA